MALVRYIKLKLFRLLSSRGLLLLIPAFWLCMLLWSAQKADHAIHNNIEQRHGHPARDVPHALVTSLHKAEHAGRRASPAAKSHHDALDLGHRRGRSAGKKAASIKGGESIQKSKPISMLELLIGGRGGGAKNMEHAAGRQAQITLSKSRERAPQALAKPPQQRSQVTMWNSQHDNTAFKTHSSWKQQKQQVQPIPVTRDLDYRETEWQQVASIHGLVPSRSPILPGSRHHPPKLGEDGEPVRIDPSTLDPSERAVWHSGWENHKFNEYVSTQISIERDVPDHRPAQCHNQPFSLSLPKASIIVCFYNEAWTVLLRTIHSVFRKSPPELVTEVILVDDFSDRAEMHEPLDEYVAQVDKLRLLRMTKRSGLVRARLAGIKEAVGPVVIFLDSHVECEEGWLPPLLQTIFKHPDVAVTPEIDVIDHKTFSVDAAIDNIGGMDFRGLVFNWMQALPRVMVNRTSDADVLLSPTMAGGLFAINKQFFLQMGTYDPGLELWGGENIELSLKMWMCGGGILIHPCSRVAHIFREVSPYLKGETSNVVIKNSARVAQVWLDEYKKFYFQDGTYNEQTYGSVEDQVKLRQHLKCRSFGWYLEHIYPELHIEDSGPFNGKMKSWNGLCIHHTGSHKKSPLVLADCALAMRWEMTRMKEIRSKSLCMEYDDSMSPIMILSKCDLEGKRQLFMYTQARAIYHPLSKLCLGVTLGSPSSLSFQQCTGHASQTWDWPTNHHHIP